jgi:type I restriction enzyme R subunit
MGLTIDQAVKDHIYLNDKKIVDWHKDGDITGKINIDLSDAIYELLLKFDLDTNWDDIDHLIEECLKIAIHKYK